MSKKLLNKWFTDRKDKTIIYDESKDGRLYKINKYGDATLIAKKELKNKK